MTPARLPLPPPREDDDTMVALHSPKEVHPEITAVTVFARSRVGQLAWKLLTALLSVVFTAGVWLAQSEWRKYSEATAAQTAAVEAAAEGVARLADKITALETRLGGLESRLEKVEERYAGEVAKLAAQVAELQLRMEKAEAQRGAAARRWQSSMERWDEEEDSLDQRFERVIRRVLGQNPRGRR